MLSLKHVQQSIHTLIDRLMPEATVLQYVMQLHPALSAIMQPLSQPTVQVDETSLRVDRKNHWIHVYASGNLTLKFHNPNRGREVIEAINVIPRYGGIIVHDC